MEQEDNMEKSILAQANPRAVLTYLQPWIGHNPAQALGFYSTHNNYGIVIWSLKMYRQYFVATALKIVLKVYLKKMRSV